MASNLPSQNTEIDSDIKSIEDLKDQSNHIIKEIVTQECNTIIIKQSFAENEVKIKENSQKIANLLLESKQIEETLKKEYSKRYQLTEHFNAINNIVNSLKNKLNQTEVTFQKNSENSKVMSQNIDELQAYLKKFSEDLLPKLENAGMETLKWHKFNKVIENQIQKLDIDKELFEKNHDKILEIVLSEEYENKNKIEILENKIKELNSKFENELSVNNELNDELEKLIKIHKTSIIAFKADEQNFQTEIDEKKTQINDEENTISDLEKKVEILQEQNLTQNKDTNFILESTKNLENLWTDREENINNLQAEKISEIEDNQNKKQIQDETINNLNEEIKKLQEALDEKKGDAGNLKEEKKNSYDYIEEKKKIHDENSETTKSLENKISLKKSLIEELNKRCENEINKIKIILQEKKVEVQEKRNIKDQLIATIKMKIQDLEDSEKKNVTQQTQQEKIHEIQSKKIAKSKQEHEKLKSKYAKQKQEMKNLQKSYENEIKQIESITTEKSKDLLENLTKIKQQHETNTKKQEEIQEKEKQIIIEQSEILKLSMNELEVKNANLKENTNLIEKEIQDKVAQKQKLTEGCKPKSRKTIHKLETQTSAPITSSQKANLKRKVTTLTISSDEDLTCPSNKRKDLGKTNSQNQKTKVSDNKESVFDFSTSDDDFGLTQRRTNDALKQNPPPMDVEPENLDAEPL